MAVVQFPGTNCERETARSLSACFDGPVDVIWHAEAFPHDRYAMVVLPGGFAYGDHLRAGAIARFSPVMQGIQTFAQAGGLVLGICNGFQVLLEAGLLPGAMLRNASLQFRSEWVWCRVERTDTSFTSAYRLGQVLRLPIAHGEGNYVSVCEPRRHCLAVPTDGSCSNHSPWRSARRRLHERREQRENRRAPSSRLWPPPRRVPADRQSSGSRADAGRARHARRDVERALQLQAFAQAPEAATYERSARGARPG